MSTIKLCIRSFNPIIHGLTMTLHPSLRLDAQSTIHISYFKPAIHSRS